MHRVRARRGEPHPEGVHGVPRLFGEFETGKVKQQGHLHRRRIRQPGFEILFQEIPEPEFLSNGCGERKDWRAMPERKSLDR